MPISFSLSLFFILLFLMYFFIFGKEQNCKYIKNYQNKVIESFRKSNGEGMVIWINANDLFCLPTQNFFVIQNCEGYIDFNLGILNKTDSHRVYQMVLLVNYDKVKFEVGERKVYKFEINVKKGSIKRYMIRMRFKTVGINKPINDIIILFVNSNKNRNKENINDDYKLLYHRLNIVCLNVLDRHKYNNNINNKNWNLSELMYIVNKYVEETANSKYQKYLNVDVKNECDLKHKFRAFEAILRRINHSKYTISITNNYTDITPLLIIPFSGLEMCNRKIIIRAQPTCKNVIMIENIHEYCNFMENTLWFLIVENPYINLVDFEGKLIRLPTMIRYVFENSRR